jgi:hypothetical protein
LPESVASFEVFGFSKSFGVFRTARSTPTLGDQPLNRNSPHANSAIQLVLHRDGNVRQSGQKPAMCCKKQMRYIRFPEVCGYLMAMSVTHR